MSTEEWSRSLALNAVKDAVAGLDGEYDDETQVFFDVKYGDESLVVTVTDATDDSLTEEFIINFE
ncbi:hypothetical protein SEA_WATERT_73 [Microbacterium phage WaterT]|nr:hypothetical protein SEA_WATERT_73 [Microbacterium phage WaterT]QOC59395.1 hypothetical protein SEA_LIFES_70 [Microbacterium phage Lifes]